MDLSIGREKWPRILENENGNGKGNLEVEMEMELRKWKYGNGNESQYEKMKSWEWKQECIPRKHYHRIILTQLGNVFTPTRKCEPMKMITF